MSRKVKVLTYNVHSFLDLKGLNTQNNLIRWLKNLDADIVALQEVRMGRRGNLFKDLVPLYHVYAAPTQTCDASTYGNVVLSKYPAVNKTIHDLTFKKKESRNCIDLTLEVGNFNFKIYALHLGLAQREKFSQVNTIFEKILRPLPRVPEIVLGDFNHVFDWPLLKRYLIKGGYNWIKSPTFPSRFPLLKLDQIWYRDLSLEKKIKFNYKDVPFSDHLPLGAIFENGEK